MGRCKLHIGVRLSGIGAALTGALLVAGCVTAPTAGVVPAPGPPLELLASGPLQIPAGCDPAGGTVYRTDFVVRVDGRVSDAAPGSGSGCVQEALRQWVATFEYRPPPGGPVTAVVDWMAVQASRQGLR